VKARHALLILSGLWLGALLRFVLDLPPLQPTSSKADAVIVLTGGKGRLEHGVRILADGGGKRLLISGVNPLTSKPILVESMGLPKTLLGCCVDLGHAAGDTVGNADEARRWMTRQGYSSMRLVTSRTHMPRALLEFRAQMPEMKIIADPVEADAGAVARLVEFHKYLVRLILLRTGLAV
jgi:uncharacterized SAM-binding protein YcdF (DUF218 family)